MKPEIPEELVHQAARWTHLSKRERASLGKALRKAGLAQAEIRRLIPVAKSTLSYWCRAIDLNQHQVDEIRSRMNTRAGKPRDTQRKRREEILRIRRVAQQRASELSHDPLFASGVALYWAEGAKSQSDLALANTDPALLRLFITWVRDYLDERAEFRLSLHLHRGNDEKAAKHFWRQELGLPTARFTKTFIKRPGTGHRKNHLAHGVCRVRVCRSTNHWHKTMAWIEHMRDQHPPSLATLAPGR